MLLARSKLEESAVMKGEFRVVGWSLTLSRNFVNLVKTLRLVDIMWDYIC